MRRLLFLSFSFLAIGVLAQESRRLVWEGSAAIDYELIKNFRFNTSIAQRTSFLEDSEGNLTEFSFLEFNQFLTKKISPTWKVSVGYKYRMVDPIEELDVFEHRLTQQAAFTHIDKRFRLVSRVRLEQRMRSSSFAHRYRYRLSTDFPLSGEKIDAREFFLVFSSEALFEAVSGGLNTWENRLSASLGYAVSNNIKADLTVTYRIEDINLEFETILFISTGLNIKLN
jgi:hypothetical protein